ncbi:MAG: rhodanese-like domain-containing protein [Kordiimonadaceae bacterium]|jgi:rhodanese-related sulfurtransferase|nr:rhodanese-like domain-containing protein [Kordiimonadaceae bacterium]MBT6036960.1 rhodanese-like domain-containing protein [Kordiimonadaceae bacterium]MBT6330534.1 rhodanese-like domain-containing protein [Kordiimonadaceae bacterium]MBT7582393.1 rhodanese-like domain-containing protein [Kordiimonadaceae bacterium]
MNEPTSLFERFFWWLPFGSVPEVSSESLANNIMDAKLAPQILDVRSPGEWKGGHIPGAINVPIGELKGRLSSLALDKEKPVVAICLHARRSIPAVRLLKAKGYQNVTQLEGGMTAWRSLSLIEE